jgi:hypothetical protein
MPDNIALMHEVGLFEKKKTQALNMKEKPCDQAEG